MLVLKWRTCPSLVQVISGGGYAWTSHSKDTMWPSVTLTSSSLGPVILGGTAKRESCISQYHSKDFFGVFFFVLFFFYKADSSQLRCLSACACCSPSFIYTAQKQQSPGHPLSPVVCEALKDTRENKESKHRETRHPDLDAGWERCGSVCTQSCQRGNKNADVCQRSGTVVDQILTIVTILHIEKYIFIHMKFKD